MLLLTIALTMPVIVTVSLITYFNINFIMDAIVALSNWHNIISSYDKSLSSLVLKPSHCTHTSSYSYSSHLCCNYNSIRICACHDNCNSIRICACHDNYNSIRICACHDCMQLVVFLSQSLVRLWDTDSVSVFITIIPK